MLHISCQKIRCFVKWREPIWKSSCNLSNHKNYYRTGFHESARSALKAGQIGKMKGEVLEISTSAIVKPLMVAQIYSVSLVWWDLRVICIDSSSHITSQWIEVEVLPATVLYSSYAHFRWENNQSVGLVPNWQYCVVIRQSPFYPVFYEPVLGLRIIVVLEFPGS